jgi:hypothetical protein
MNIHALALIFAVGYFVVPTYVSSKVSFLVHPRAFRMRTWSLDTLDLWNWSRRKDHSGSPPLLTAEQYTTLLRSAEILQQ